jgi:hypothetical protein
VARIGAPLKTHDNVGLFSENIDNLSLAFVTPLCSNDDNI